MLQARSRQSTAPDRERGSRPQPFLKWAGGKGALIPQLEPLFPRRFERYFEPFLGGGAVFLHLRPRQPVLSDLNARLIDCYLAVRDHCGQLIVHLERLRKAHSKAHYYLARDRFNSDEEMTLAERVALYIYLNKTCFNGLYRVNSRGQFNVPIGRYDNPGVYDAENLAAVSRLLTRAMIELRPFETIVDEAEAGDFVYFDPPYHPVSKTSNFTSFTREGFGLRDQERLAEVFEALDKRGCLLMQSNSDTAAIKRLYRGYHIARVSARRSINSKSRRRGPIDELVIRNYT